MLILPIETRDHKHDTLIVMLDRDNLARILQNDPAEIPLGKTGRRLVNPTVMIAFNDRSPELQRLVQGGDVKAIIEYLQRGFAFRPDKGDHDRGPESLKDSN